jgi:dimethylglycine dehydrogenase
MANSHTILVIAGPQSRALLQSVSPRCDWSRDAFPWLRCQSMFIGHAEVVAMTVSFSGELAYELHVPNEQLYLVWHILNQAGKDFSLGNFGLYATESMRLEKGYLHWKADLIVEHNPFETRLEHFVKLDKPDFIGKQALLDEIERGPRKLLVSMTVECDIAPAHGGDPVFAGEQQIGSVTSAGFGHRVGKNIAYAYVEPASTAIGTPLAIGILGERYSAEVVEAILYDPDNRIPRS